MFCDLPKFASSAKVTSLFYLERNITLRLSKACDFCSINCSSRKMKIYSDVGDKCKLCVLCIKCNTDVKKRINFEIFFGNSWNFLCAVYDFCVP